MSDKKNDFWYYTRRERQAVLTLLALVLLLFLLPALYRFQPKEQSALDTSLFQQEIERFEAAQPGHRQDNPVAQLFNFDPNTVPLEDLIALGLPTATANTIIKYRQKGGSFRRAEDLQKIYNMPQDVYQRLSPFISIARSADEQDKPRHAPEQQFELFTFDPNTLSLDELSRLGIPQKTAGNLIKYREKGGRFRNAVDMRKIYGLSDALFQRLEPYIRIAPEDQPNQASEAITEATKAAPQRAIPVSYESPKPVLIDINQATTEHWQQLYGIGPVLSGRIVKFRDKLGGFISIDQVAETYGLPDSTFQSIRTQLTYSPITHPIAINKLSAEQLKEHPYIKWQQAKVMVAYRREHGPFKNLEDLRKVRALTDEFLERLAPYLQYN